MSNIQLSSRSDEWHSPAYLIEMCKQVLGHIDLDPASSELANKTIQADRFIDKEENGLIAQWCNIPATIFLNPPGGKIANKSMACEFWKRLMAVREAGLLEHAIFMGFSIEQLAITQGLGIPSLCDFPLCVPKKRIKFVSPSGDFNAPTHANVIAYVPGIENKTSLFKETFSKLGAMLHGG